MSAACYLFIPAMKTLDSASPDFSSLSWVVDDTVHPPISKRGSLRDLASQANQYPVIVVLPGEQVTFFTTKIPGNNRQRVRQALPYTLEDYLVDDVETLHFSIADEVSDENYQVAVTDKAYFKAIINELKHVNINPLMITADYMLLADNDVVFESARRVLFNGSKLKFTADLASVVNQHDIFFNKDSSLTLVRNETQVHSESELEKCLSENIVKKEFCEGDEQVCLVKFGSYDNGINLLQGAFRKKRNWSQTRKKWLPLAALLLIWLSLQGGMFLVDYINLTTQNKKLNSEIVRIYRNTFPDSHRVIDAQAQMKQQLASLKKRKGQQGRGFTEMLSASSEVLTRFKGLKIKSLRYFDGQINLELQLESLQELDKLKKQLSEDKGYQVDIQNASAEKEFVTARLQISGVAL